MLDPARLLAGWPRDGKRLRIEPATRPRSNRSRSWPAAGLLAAGSAALLTPTPAAAWWDRDWGYRPGCCWRPPVVVGVAPPVVAAPPVVVTVPPPAVYAPAPVVVGRVWVPGHWRRGYWVGGHWR